jgi:hypothetical protein
MSRRSEEREVTVTHIETTLSEAVCDICKTTTANWPDYPVVNWAGQLYDRDRIGVYRETGNVYPEGSSLETTAFDICPGCWEQHVEPFLRSLGATPRVTEFDT